MKPEVPTILSPGSKHEDLEVVTIVLNILVICIHIIALTLLVPRKQGNLKGSQKLLLAEAVVRRCPSK